MALPFGTDVDCVSDTGPVDRILTSPFLVVGQRVARRLQTPRGGLASVGDDPSFGWDVRQYLNGKLSPTALVIAQQQISSECVKDEEVDAATVTISFVNGGAMTINVSLDSTVGTFSLVLDITQVSFDVLVTK